MSIPRIVNYNKVAFEPLIKLLLTEIIGGDITEHRIDKVNVIKGKIKIEKKMISGYEDIDLTSKANSKALEELLDALYIKCRTDIMNILRAHQSKFIKNNA